MTSWNYIQKTNPIADLLNTSYYNYNDSLVPRFEYSPRFINEKASNVCTISDILYTVKLDSNGSCDYIPLDVMSLIIVYVGYNNCETIEFDAIVDGGNHNYNCIRLIEDDIILKNRYVHGNAEVIGCVKQLSNILKTKDNIFEFDYDGRSMREHRLISSK